LPFFLSFFLSSPLFNHMRGLRGNHLQHPSSSSFFPARFTVVL
jgi:hypothetical protein